MPVDWRVRFDFDVTPDASTAGKSNIFLGITEHFQAEQRVEPLPEPLQNAFAAHVFAAVANNDIAATALSEALTVEDLVRA